MTLVNCVCLYSKKFASREKVRLVRENPLNETLLITNLTSVSMTVTLHPHVNQTSQTDRSFFLSLSLVTVQRENASCEASIEDVGES